MDGPLSVQIPVQFVLELEPNLLVQNVIELEFELSIMYMKRPLEYLSFSISFALIDGNKLMQDWVL